MWVRGVRSAAMSLGHSERKEIPFIKHKVKCCIQYCEAVKKEGVHKGHKGPNYVSYNIEVNFISACTCYPSLPLDSSMCMFSKLLHPMHR